MKRLALFVAVAVLISALIACGGGSTPELHVGAATEMELLAPSDFVSASEGLPDAVAELNKAQLTFIRDSEALASSPAVEPMVAAGAVSRQGVDLSRLDLDLRNVAANAMNVGNLARALAETIASQDGGSDAAGQQASLYRGVANAGYALVIEAQNAREGLAGGSVTAAAARQVIGEYGARLWNPAVGASSGNPFASSLSNPSSVPAAQAMSPEQQASLQGQLPPGSTLTSWLAASAETLEKTVTVPPPRNPMEDPLSPAVLAGLTNTDAQLDADTARQVAAAALNGAPPEDDPEFVPGESYDVVSQMFAAVAVAGGGESAPPTISGGQGAATTTGGGGGEPDVVSTILQFGPNGDPKATASTPVQETKPVVALTITNLKITNVSERPKDQTSTFDAEVLFEFDVSWASTIVNPVFEMDCVSGNRFEVTTAGGSRHIQAKGLLILYPGNEDAYCSASRNGNTLGSTSVRFLVGSAAGATARANLVETQSAELDITLTADAHASETAQAGSLTPTATSETTETPTPTSEAAETPTATSEAAETPTRTTVPTGEAAPTGSPTATKAAPAATATEVQATATRTSTPTPTRTPTRTPSATAVPPTLTPVPTVGPVFYESIFFPGDLPAMNTSLTYQAGVLYQFCFSGIVYVEENGAVVGKQAWQLPMHVSGIAVPPSGCVTVQGTGGTITITCGHGVSAADPGGYSITVYQLGPVP